MTCLCYNRFKLIVFPYIIFDEYFELVFMSALQSFTLGIDVVLDPLYMRDARDGYLYHALNC